MEPTAPVAHVAAGLRIHGGARLAGVPIPTPSATLGQLTLVDAVEGFPPARGPQHAADFTHECPGIYFCLARHGVYPFSSETYMALQEQTLAFLNIIRCPTPRIGRPTATGQQHRRAAPSQALTRSRTTGGRCSLGRLPQHAAEGLPLGLGTREPTIVFHNGGAFFP